MTNEISSKLFEADPDVRYVAINQGGEVVEMAQNPKWPSHNPSETDRMEEFVVNPAILELAKRRGELDLDGIRYVVIRYGPQYQLLFPYKNGHISIGVELKANIAETASRVAHTLDLPI